MGKRGQGNPSAPSHLKVTQACRWLGPTPTASHSGGLGRAEKEHFGAFSGDGRPAAHPLQTSPCTSGQTGGESRQVFKQSTHIKS